MKYNIEFMEGLESELDHVTYSIGYKYLGKLGYSFEELGAWLFQKQKSDTYLEVRGAVYEALMMSTRDIPLHLNLTATLRERIIGAVLKYRLKYRLKY